jgi:predicted Rossmann fold nucleotide-binding protein DprA/Smf involved in DNA uptake
MKRKKGINLGDSHIQLFYLKNLIYPLDRLSGWFISLPFLYAIGNINLLNLPLIALFCSRKCPGDAILKAYDLAQELCDKETPVISGFHTPVEKDMLDIMIKGKGPIVMCPARGLDGMRVPVKLRKRLEEGTLLFCSIADPKEKRITAEIAEERNILVAALAAEWKFVYIEQGGKLELLYQQLNAIVQK